MLEINVVLQCSKRYFLSFISAIDIPARYRVANEKLTSRLEVQVVQTEANYMLCRIQSIKMNI